VFGEANVLNGFVGSKGKGKGKDVDLYKD